MRAQEFIAESNNTAVMAKLADSGKIVRILKKAHSVQFSDKKDWLLIDTDPAKGNRGLGAKWIPANTKFEWVRPYLEKIDESVDAKKIVSYIKKIQGDGHFHMDNLVTRYPSWRLIQIPLSKLTINPDPEKKNPLGTNINVDLDYVQDITPHDIANRPIVVDPSGWIIDGNHRATRAEELGMKSIPAYVPVKQGVAEGRENFNGIDISMEIQKDDEYVDDEDYDNQVLYVTASSKGKELGHVLFAFDGEYLMPQDLEVEERYRGQGIAQIMYDYVKSKGYKIRRSGQQTDAGAGFWDKHMPGKNVWEQGVAENFADGKGPGRPGDSQRHGIPKHATMAELEKASHAKGRKGQLARWQLNMRRGKAKAKKE